ncbi:MAG: hypothetical protein ABR543_11455 [Gemmatimonadaceae bacterium]
MERECRVFCKYLVGQAPNAYVLGKYVDGHRSSNFRTHGPAQSIDRLLMRIALAQPLGTRLADTYARVFVPRSVLRHKLVLLLAIIESCAPTHEFFDGPPKPGLPSLAFEFARAGVGFAIAFAVGCILLLPAHAVLSLAQTRRNDSTPGALARANHS